MLTTTQSVAETKTNAVLVRKQWATPVVQMHDVEDLTMGGTTRSDDGGGGSS